jgi:chemotaxis protein methyltransferase CheR
MPLTMTAEATEAEACQYIARLAYDRCRIRLHDGKDALIKARLGRRMRELGMAGLAEYCDYLRTTDDEAEFTRLINALTTHFTGFFREADHFKFLVEQALPSIRPGHRKAIHIWSAASSSGEEPYSIGLYLSEHCPPALGWDWRIAASDISTKMLEEARLGIYPMEHLGAIPREWLRKYFQKGVGRWEGYCRVKPGIAGRVSFRQINLIEPYDHPQPFEVIFCRNVLIYFDHQTQHQIVKQACRFLAHGGYLIIGHSESLNGLDLPLRCLQPSIYQRSLA